MLLIYLIVFISEVVWSATLVKLFKKFGWVLALVAVLLLVVVAVFVIIDKSYNTVDDNFVPKSSKIEKLDETQEKTRPNEYGQEKKVRDHVEKNSEEMQTESKIAVKNELGNQLENKQTEIKVIEPKISKSAENEKSKSINNLGNRSTNKEAITSENGLTLENSEEGSSESDLNLNSSANRKRVNPSELKNSNTIASEQNIEPGLKTESPQSSLTVDVMRVDDKGEALVAGKAEPNVAVEILANEKVIGKAESDDQGEFVVIGNVKPSLESKTLTVRSIKENLSKVPEINPESSEIMETNKESTVELEWTLSDDIFIILPLNFKNDNDASESAASAPVIVQSSSDDIKIIQNKEIIQVEEIIIDSISYSDLGEAILVGRANPSNQVLVYLNNILMTSSKVGASGGWSTELTGLEPGLYELRLDEVDRSGSVRSRIMTPFKKESKDFLVNMVSGSITVQTGNSLWRIARRIFGKGIRYIEIYEKNNNLIKDPDLIYPGQVFSIPTED